MILSSLSLPLWSQPERSLGEIRKMGFGCEALVRPAFPGIGKQLPSTQDFRSGFTRSGLKLVLSQDQSLGEPFKCSSARVAAVGGRGQLDPRLGVGAAQRRKRAEVGSRLRGYPKWKGCKLRRSPGLRCRKQSRAPRGFSNTRTNGFS